MKTQKAKIFGALSTLILFLIIASPAFAQPCATISLSATPSSVSPGQTVELSASLASCSSSPEIVRVAVTFSGPNFSNVMASYYIRLKPGQSLSYSESVVIPTWLPAGTYTVTGTVFSGTTELSTSTATLTVT